MKISEHLDRIKKEYWFLFFAMFLTAAGITFEHFIIKYTLFEEFGLAVVYLIISLFCYGVYITKKHDELSGEV